MIDIIYEFHIYIYIYVGEKMFQIIGISLLHMGMFVVILLWHVIDVRQQMPRTWLGFRLDPQKQW